MEARDRKSWNTSGVISCADVGTTNAAASTVSERETLTYRGGVLIEGVFKQRGID